MGIKKPNGFGTASLILGIISIILCWVPFLGLICGILAIIFSVKQKKTFPNGLATAGLVTGIIGLVISVIYLIIWIMLLVAFSSFLTSLSANSLNFTIK